jgi:hypothetical protein
MELNVEQARLEEQARMGAKADVLLKHGATTDQVLETLMASQGASQRSPVAPEFEEGPVMQGPGGPQDVVQSIYMFDPTSGEFGLFNAITKQLLGPEYIPLQRAAAPGAVRGGLVEGQPAFVRPVTQPDGSVVMEAVPGAQPTPPSTGAQDPLDRPVTIYGPDGRVTRVSTLREIGAVGLGPGETTDRPRTGEVAPQAGPLDAKAAVDEVLSRWTPPPIGRETAEDVWNRHRAEFEAAWPSLRGLSWLAVRSLAERSAIAPPPRPGPPAMPSHESREEETQDLLRRMQEVPPR